MMSWIDLTRLRTDMGSGCLLVKEVLQLADRLLVAGAAAECLEQLHRRAERVERRHLEHVEVEQGGKALVLVLEEQRFEDGTGLGAVLGEDIALANVVDALPARERRPIEGDVADQVEGIEVHADLFLEWLEQQAL